MVMRFGRACVLLAALASAVPAAAQQFPARPLTIVVAFPAGGPTDTIARLLAEPMARDLGQPVTIDNVTGAGGTIGAARVARAPADGYTLMLHQLALAAAQSLYGQLPYDAATDFDGVGLINLEPMVIVGRVDLPARTLPELVSWLGAHRNGVSFANSGIGTPSHLCAVMFISGIGAQVTEVPYRGGGPAYNDVLARQVDLFCGQSFAMVGPIQAGTVHGFAVTTHRRTDALPDLPTLDESGHPDLEIATWHGLYVPRGTPAPVVARLAAALGRALDEHEVVVRLTAAGSQMFEPAQRTPAAAKQLLVDEIVRWRKVIKENHISRD